MVTTGTGGRDALNHGSTEKVFKAKSSRVDELCIMVANVVALLIYNPPILPISSPYSENPFKRKLLCFHLTQIGFVEPFKSGSGQDRIAKQQLLALLYSKNFFFEKPAVGLSHIKLNQLEDIVC